MREGRTTGQDITRQYHIPGAWLDLPVGSVNTFAFCSSALVAGF